MEELEKQLRPLLVLKSQLEELEKTDEPEQQEQSEPIGSEAL